MIIIACDCPNLVVGGLQDKCNHYWPVDTKPMYYGDLKVEVLSESKSTDWVVTKLEVSMVSLAPVRQC